MAESESISIAFEVPGKPVAKGRPRFARHGKSVQTYSDVKTANYEALVSWYATLAMVGKAKLEGPLRAEIRVTLAVPQSWSKKKRAAAVYPVCRPDIDNQIKSAIDGINGVVFADDAQICELYASKRYGAMQGVRIILSTLEGTYDHCTSD